MGGCPRVVRLLVAGSMVVAGSAILVFGLPEGVTDRFKGPDYENVGTLLPGDPGFPEFESRYPVHKIERIAVSFDRGRPYLIDVAQYLDVVGRPRRAQIFLPDESGGGQYGGTASDMNRLRWQAWLDASALLQSPILDQSLIIAWWDNAQRIDLLSGATTWSDAPTAEAFEWKQRDVWKTISGGFAPTSERLRQLATWLLSDANRSLESIDRAIGGNREFYFLVTVDDLARLSEMSALSGKQTPFETRVFRSDDNIHSLIARVKRWAKEKGSGSYLVQHLGATGVRVWRITNEEGERTLLAKLLPFTSSLKNPLKGVDLLYRSEWSAFISVYRRKHS